MVISNTFAKSSENRARRIELGDVQSTLCLSCEQVALERSLAASPPDRSARNAPLLSLRTDPIRQIARHHPGIIAKIVKIEIAGTRFSMRGEPLARPRKDPIHGHVPASVADDAPLFERPTRTPNPNTQIDKADRHEFL